MSDNAILITDRKFGGADTLATSNTIAAALKKIAAEDGCDFNHCRRTSNWRRHCTSRTTNRRTLGLPQVSYVKMKYDEADKSSTIKRVVEDGYYLLKVQTPALVTVLSEANQPRYIESKGIVEAFDQPITTWGFADIDIDEKIVGLAGSPTKKLRSHLQREQKLPEENCMK